MEVWNSVVPRNTVAYTCTGQIRRSWAEAPRAPWNGCGLCCYRIPRKRAQVNDSCSMILFSISKQYPGLDLWHPKWFVSRKYIYNRYLPYNSMHSKSLHHVLRPIHEKTSRNYEQAQEVFGTRYQNLHRSMHPTRTSPIHRLSGANVFLMTWLPNTTGRLGWSMLQLCGEIHRGNLGSSGFGPWW